MFRRLLATLLSLTCLLTALPLAAEDEAPSGTQLLERGIEHAKVGDLEEARAAFRRALECGDDLDSTVSQVAAAIMLGNGEAGLAVRLEQPLLKWTDELIEAMEFEEFEESEIKPLKDRREEYVAMLARHRELAQLEERVRQKTAPEYVASVIRKLTSHHQSISSTYLKFEDEEQAHELRDAYRTARWFARATVAKDGRSVTHLSREGWLGRDAIWARFDEVLKLLTSQAQVWKRSFAERPGWTDVECTAWFPPELPFAEDDRQVLRRVEFRWTAKRGEGPPASPVATLSVLRPTIQLEDGRTAFGGHYILELVATSTDLR